MHVMVKTVVGCIVAVVLLFFAFGFVMVGLTHDLSALAFSAFLFLMCFGVLKYVRKLRLLSKDLGDVDDEF